MPGVYLAPELMDRYALKPGDRLTVLTAGIEHELHVLGRMPSAGGTGLGENLAVMDIAAAQEIFGKVGYLDRIDVIAQGDVGQLADSLDTGLRLTDRTGRKATLEAMLYSFQLNLAAMSLLALFVGIFLIYNFSMFSVLSRREDLSLLLTLGTDNRDLVRAFLAESVLLGAIGSFLGIAFGYSVAWTSIDRVSSTISELYFQVQVQRVDLTWGVVLSGLGVGFFATMLGTAIPAVEVSGTPPILGMKRQTIEDKARALKGWLLLAGGLCFIASVVAGWASRFSVFWGFASAFGVTLAFALCTPAFLAPFTHYAGIALKKGLRALEAFLAARTIGASLSRTSMAVAALAVALAMTIGVDNMIYSFRTSVQSWLDGSLQGDLYISPGTTKWAHPLPDSLIESLRADPRIEALERYSTYEIALKDRPVRLRVIDADVLRQRTTFRFLKGDASRAWEQLGKGDVFVSESLAFRFGLKMADSIVLQSPRGPREFSVAAIVRDYSSDQGTVHMDRAVYEDLWEDPRVQSVAIFLKDAGHADAVRRRIIRDYPGLRRTIVSNARMRDNILVIFDKTFAPTATLKGVSLMVALLGVATALMAILIERSREMTVLGYLGLTPSQLGRINVYQALIMGIAAFVIALLCGVVLTYIIIYAINYRSFGWSIDLRMNPMVFAKSLGLTLLACLASSVYPTYKLIKSQRLSGLDDE
jgi:putative ABC transport system permease protein